MPRDEPHPATMLDLAHAVATAAGCDAACEAFVRRATALPHVTAAGVWLSADPTAAPAAWAGPAPLPEQPSSEAGADGRPAPQTDHALRLPLDPNIPGAGNILLNLDAAPSPAEVDAWSAVTAILGARCATARALLTAQEDAAHLARIFED